ncbi:MAG: PAS domain S-box protein [Bacillota bacterium]
MNKSKNSGQRLRKPAEEMLRRKAAIIREDATKLTPEKIEQTLYELRVHQIELELQNEELRRVQTELEASRAQYFDFYNLAPVGYCTISAAGLLLEVNLTFAAMLAMVSNKLIHKPFSRFIWGADLERYYLFIKSLFATSEPQSCELRLVKVDQTTFCAQLVGSRTTGAEGAAECRLVVSDISERKQVEEKYAALFNNSVDAIFVADPASRQIVDCNQAAELLTGYSRSELLSIQADDLHPHDRLQETMAGFQKQLEGSKAVVDSEVLNKDNDRIPVEITSTPINVESGNYIFGVFKNISERIKIERELVASDLYNKSLIKAIPYLMFVLDKDGVFLDYSAGADENLAMPKELFMGKSVFEALPESLANQIKKTIDEALSGQLVKPFEYSLPVPSGAAHFECIISPFGESKVISIISNITERKIAEAQQQRYLSLVDATLESTADGILVVDKDWRVLRYNQKFSDLWRLPPDIADRTGSDEAVIEHFVAQAADADKFMTTIMDIYNKPEETSLDIVEFKDGRIIERYSQPHRLAGVAVGRVWSFRDITEKKLGEEHIRYLSFHDVLTGLYNRRYFEEEILRIDTARQLPISIISGDVNGLKLTNDVFGHANGDELIKTAAHYIQDCCRAEDAVVRFGGDEFMVVLPKCDAATARGIVERIQAQCRDKTSAGLPVSLALGAATKTETSEDINTIVNIAESRMYKNKSHDLERVRLDTLEALERTVYEKDNKMDHALRLRDLAIGFSGYLQLSNGTVSDVALLATLHDIGKIAIPDEIINKTGSLSAEEWAIVQTHAEIGNRILRATRLVSFAVEQGVLSHHEHWNGSGYPNGLRAEAIPFISRVIAIIDAYDVMTNDRAYRQAITNKQAIAELRRCAGSQFDPELVAKFVEFIGA